MWRQFQINAFIEGQQCRKFPFFHIVTPKTAQKWAWIGIFKLNMQKNFCIVKTNEAIPNKFSTVINTLCGSSQNLPHKSKMAEGHNFEKKYKLLYLSKGLTDFDEIFHADAHWQSGP